MLIAIREKVTGWVALVFVAVIALLMVVPLLYDYVSGVTRKDALSVNGDTISMQQFDQRVSEETNRLLQVYGAESADSQELKSLVTKTVTESFINKLLLDQATIKDGFTVSDKNLKEAILSTPAFQKDGQFDLETYNRQLSSVGYNKAYYERMLALDLARDQFIKGVNRSSFSLPSQVSEYAKLQNQSRTFDVATINFDALKASVVVQDDEVKAYYESHKDQFKSPESAIVDYVLVNLDEFKKDIEISDKELKSEYEAGLNAGRYQIPELRKASHILLEVKEDASEEEVENVRQKALALIEKIKSGESFAELAKQESADTGSAAQGGSLGEVTRGVMVPAFEKSVYAQTLQEVGEPVKTRFGFHIIKVDEITDAQNKPFDAVKTEIANELKSSRAKTQYNDLLIEVADSSEENAEDLAQVAKETGLALQTSELFTRTNGTGVMSDSKIRDLAFSDRVLFEGLNSDVFNISDSQSIVLRIREHNEAREQTYKEAYEQAKIALLDSKTAQLATDKASEILESLKAGAVISTFAKSDEVKVQENASVTRSKMGGFSPQLIRAVFSTAKPAEGKSTYSMTTVDKNKVVYALKSVKEGDVESLTTEEKERISGLLRSQQGNNDYVSVLNGLRESADIWISPDLKSSEGE